MAAVFTSEWRQVERGGTHLVRGYCFHRGGSAYGRVSGIRATVRDRSRGAEILALVFQNLHRATALLHAAYNSSRRAASIAGSKTRSARQNCSISSSPLKKPVASPARYAA